jgi:hypothetical protein
MSSKEVKNLLKEAREAIKNKEFQVAIKKCKVNDKLNFFLLLALENIFVFINSGSNLAR